MEKCQEALATKIVDILNRKKVDSIELIDVKELTALTDYFVIAVCSNVRQTKATAEELEYQLEKDGYFAHQKEGYVSARWILLDYLGVIVHVLYKEDADFYGIQRLWSDGNKIEIPDLTVV
ncbi:MAG: ribosome silencing factor [Epulopiscium sp. Nele67-Bin004]|nr:MAG: ribosome silencing factor [Epulopiscium sp. Nele67-Bin004]